jgi:putative aldouronate transport system permease protein
MWPRCSARTGCTAGHERQDPPHLDGEPTPAGRALKAVDIAAVLLVVLFPLYVVVLTSISTQASVAAAGGLVIVPQGITFGAYTDLFSGGSGR